MAVRQLPSQRLEGLVIEDAQGVTVDIESEHMRTVSELNYRSYVEGKLNGFQRPSATISNTRPFSQNSTTDEE
jgi:hypothetical protein